MNKRLHQYDYRQLRAYLRAEALKLCEELSPIAVSIEIVDALRNVRVFVKCTNVEDERIDSLIKQKA